MEIGVIPGQSKCPECGREPSGESKDEAIARQRLSDVGYHHGDLCLECPEGHTWSCGVPVGRGGDESLRCPSCGETWMLTHRVEVSKEDAGRWANDEIDALPVRVHLKCPNGCGGGTMSDRCYYFTVKDRRSDSNGVTLIGYPPITGSTEGAQPYGWTESPPDEQLLITR